MSISKKEKISKIKELIKNNANDSTKQLIDKAKIGKFSIRRQDFLEVVRKERNIPEPTHISRQKSTPKKYQSNLKPIPIEVLVEEQKIGRGLSKKEYSFETSKFGKMVREYQKRLGIDELKAIEITRSIVKNPKGVRAKKKLNRIDNEIRLQFNTP